MDPLDQGTPGRVPHAAAQRPHGPGTAEAEHAPRVVGAEHREELEALLDLMRMSVELDDRCGTGAGPGGASSNDATLRAHFAELHARLGEWDERVERVRAAPGALWGWFERSAPREGISEPPFAVGALIDRLAILSCRRWIPTQIADARKIEGLIFVADYAYARIFENFCERPVAPCCVNAIRLSEQKELKILVG